MYGADKRKKKYGEMYGADKRQKNNCTFFYLCINNFATLVPFTKDVRPGAAQCCMLFFIFRMISRSGAIFTDKQ